MSDDPFGVTVLYGAPGVGKTTLCREIIAQYAKFGAVLVLDITGDIARELPDTLNLSIVSNAESYKAHTAAGGWRLFTAAWNGWGPGDVVVVTPSGGDLEGAANLFIYLATHHERRREFLLVVCDEAEQLFPHTNRVSPELREALLVARNERRAMVFATKRPTGVSPFIRSAARRACVFRVQSDADAKACEELGPSALFKRKGGGVQYLETGKFLYYSGSEHTPDSELPVMDSRTKDIPWLSEAKKHFKGYRKRK